MPLPSNASIALPLLKLLEDKNKHTKREVVEKLKTHFSITPEEWEEFVPSKTKRKFDVRVLWTISQLRHAKLLKNTRRGEFKITPRGLEVLGENHEKINDKFLRRFPEYQKFVGVGSESVVDLEANTEQSPLEIFEENYQKMTNTWAEEILGLVRNCSPDAFERLVVQLVVKMGYGGTVREAGETIGGRGDEGVDGVIKEDELGFEKIYIQAKNQTSNVGRPKLQEFVGALVGKKARKGIFITSGGFTNESLKYVNKLNNETISLIDGDKLAQYMLRYNLGISTTDTFEIKKIHSDFFDDL